MIKLGPEVCNNFKKATSREWLETNGIGGFACGTVSGASTRRYHSLLTAATKPPLGRVRLAAKAEETLIVGDQRLELSANRFPGVVSPKGYELLAEFRLDPFPIWRYEVAGIALERKIFMVHGANTTVCIWQVKGHANQPVSLEVRPLIACTDYHHLQREDAKFDGRFNAQNGCVSMRPYDELAPIYFGHSADVVNPSGHWYRNFEYEMERERGFEYSEDLFQPFVLGYELEDRAVLILSTESPNANEAAKLEKGEIARRRKIVSRAPVEGHFAKRLAAAADQFIVSRGDGQTVIAGYPWFSDWGRDTMISLAGLTLATGRPKIARSILLEFSNHISEGMLPNRFADEGEEAEYNTVDATLWYFEAVRAYVESTHDYAFVRKQLYTKLSEIITWHLRGTRYGIHVDTDGLLYAGETGVQLTWMDAKVGDKVITPRMGKPVEIQALWYNALRVMAEFAERFGHTADANRFDAMADLAKLSFNALFWNEAERCLYDVVENGNRDASIRPNQILAASLTYSMLDDERSRAVVDKIESELLTPVGLRSLSPHDPNYVPYYTGPPAERDSAYHQGTVWPWLIGPFIDAFRRIYPEKNERIREILAGFDEHLANAGLGQVSEIFDAEWPHTPRGCFAQAWSVAELLRVLGATQ